MILQNQMKTSIKYGIDTIGLPIVVTSSKPHLCFLIDTGATQNIIFSFVHDYISSSCSILESSAKIIGIEGVTKEAMQIKANMAFDDKECSVIFTILEANDAVKGVQEESGIQIHGILGIPFLINNRWILDFNKLELQC